MFSGYYAKYLEIGRLNFARCFRPITYVLLLTLVLFFIGFRLFQTNSGIIRYSSFVDLQKVAHVTVTGSFLTWIAGLSINHFLPSYTAATLPFRSVIVSTLLMFLLRVAVKGMFEITCRDEQSLKATVYGVKKGGVGLAKMIREQYPQKYSLECFISPDGEMGESSDGFKGFYY